MTQHERAFIVLCIYAIVYVWIWKIWKYMLTNLYRVFYVMWNTWSRCSLLSFLLLLSLFLFFLFFKISFLGNRNISEGLDWPWWLLSGLPGHKCSYLRCWISSENADWVKLVILQSCSCWLKQGRVGRLLSSLVDKCLNTQQDFLK